MSRDNGSANLATRQTFSVVALCRIFAWVHAAALFVLLVLPFVGLVLATTASELWHSAATPEFVTAMGLSLLTTLASMFVIAVAGTPLALWLATRRTVRARMVEVLVELPIVVPRAVVGVALLYTFGRRGLLGPLLGEFGISIPFTIFAVVLAQVVVAAPFYVQAATSAFRAVPEELVVVARTLGASSVYAFLRVTLPLARPGLVSALSLSWARALGEFGATLLFAGNLAGVTRTMPLAIYTAMESDTRVAVALSLGLASMGTLLAFLLRGRRVSFVEQQVYA
jgi:molybdate transport system permease protein